MIEEQSRITSKGIIVLLILILGVAAIMYFRGTSAESYEPTLTRVQRTGRVRIGIANEAPYGYLDTETGRVTGEAPEIAREIFKRMGIRDLEVVNTEFGALIPGLKAGRFDVIAAGMYITPERCEQIDFSNPTYRIGEAFLVREGNPLDLHSFSDIKQRQDVKLGVMSGAVELVYAKKLGIDESKITIFDNNVAAIEGLKSGQVDAVAMTILTAKDLLGKTGADAGVEIADPFTQPVIDGKEVWGYGAFGFRPRDDKFRESFNHLLNGFIGTKEHLSLVEPFGFGKRTLPGDVTAEDLCNPEAQKETAG